MLFASCSMHSTLIFSFPLLLSNSHADDGFSSIRHGYKYENDRLCTASITSFECDPDAKFSTSESDITQYLKSTERIPNAECFVSFACLSHFLSTHLPTKCYYWVVSLQLLYTLQITTTIGYSGACYQQPTLAPAHCSLTGFDTTAISEWVEIFSS